MAVLAHFHVWGDPMPKPRPRATVRHRKDGTAFAHIYTPGNTAKMEKVIGMAALAAGCRQPATDPLEVALKFYTATRVRGDVDNLAKLVLDGLNGVVWRDDKQIVALYCSVTEQDPRPRTTIFVRHAAGTQTYLDLEV